MKKMIILVLSIVLVLSVFTISDNTVSAKTVKKKGVYTTATVKNSSSMMGYSRPLIKKIKVSGNKITTYGSFYYGKNNTAVAKKIKRKKRTFKIAKTCKYVLGAAPARVQRVSKKSLISRVKRNIKSNIDCENLELTVKNGKVIKMRVLQG